MVGNSKHNDKTFNEDIYEEFYEDHHFEPLSERDALNAHEVIPRFGWAFDIIDDLHPDRVLDLGCLDGSFVLTVGHNVGCDVTGVDLTKDGIEIAKRRAKQHGINGDFYQGTIEDFLEKTTKKWPVITCFEVLEHVKDPKRLLKLIDDHLEPGGSVLVSTPAFESPYYGADDEENKCHIRLYTTKDEDYEKVNKYGTLRKATSITKEIGKSRIKEMGVYSELINVWYQ
jgi:2-polyprenyl-3-methyl-5-hydroxy-6-metoxy-1,4-benzoquinol methylase